MLTFLLRRFLGIVPQLLAVSFLVAGLVHLAPGDYCDRYLDDSRGTDGSAAWKTCVQLHNYDRPFLVRYALWLGRAVTGDLGHSDEYHRPVGALIGERVVNTLSLSITALVLTWTVALTLGTLSARWPYTAIDKGSGMLAYTGLSMPSLLAALLALLFAYYSGWFPIGDLVSPGHDKMSFPAQVVDRLWHLILPASVIAFTSMAGYMRQMRSSMIETLNQDFVRTARAKGLSEAAVLFRHAFRNAINPLITLFGYSIGFLLSGSFIVEFVLNWPGMARLTVNAIQSQDEPLVLGSVLMATTLLIAGNLIADLMLGAADPRIRVEGR